MMENSKNFFLYWGKTKAEVQNTENPSCHLLVYHCLDVAAVGYQFLSKDPDLLTKIIPEEYLVGDPGRAQWFIGCISFLLALHDIGKFSDRFQGLNSIIFNKFQGRTGREYIDHHTEMGRFLFDKEIWKQIWSNNVFCLNPDDDGFDWKDIWNTWFFAVTGHHGTPPVSLSEKPVPTLFAEPDLATSLDFTSWCAEFFLKKTETQPIHYEKFYPTFCRKSWLLAGFAVLCDWIGSNNSLFEYHSQPMPLDQYWKTYAIPQADGAIKELGILPSSISRDCGMKFLFPKIRSPTPLQTFTETCEIPLSPQMIIIEEVTGSGKTEAALVLAHRMMGHGLGKGIYFGLPTMATANAMYDRMGDAYDLLFSPNSHPSLVLSHGGRHLSKKFRHSIQYPRQNEEMSVEKISPASARCTAWLADNRKKALLAQVGVGTIDQALMAVLPLHHQSLRLLGLSRNILIVDEVHAFDPYVGQVLKNLLEFHAALGGSAILISATLPREHRQALIDAYSAGLGRASDQIRMFDYPLITNVSGQTQRIKETSIPSSGLTRRTIEVECTDEREYIISELSRVVDGGKCACWIKNTVDDAIETYHLLSEKFGTDRVLLFHARFTMGERIAIEDDVLRLFGKDSSQEDRKGWILVATQVVEQSLDLDFDFMVTDLAPMDLIIQRAGRVHRHSGRGSRGAPRLLVFSPIVTELPSSDWYSSLFPKGRFVYPNHGQLWLTARLLTDRKRITMPDDARLLIEDTFGTDAQHQIPESLVEHEIRAEGKKMAEESLAHLNVLNVTTGYSDTGSTWQDDARTPTRLGARVTVLLLKWENTKLKFFSPAPEYPEDFSQISISDHRISKEFPYSGEVANHLELFKKELTDKGQYRILIPLEKTGDEWQGRALDGSGREIRVIYSSLWGLLTNKS